MARNENFVLVSGRSRGNLETDSSQERIQIIADALIQAVEYAAFFLRQYTIAAEWRQ